jgi:DNA invertase Pin-like site-specific DNA recombinase
MRAAVYVRISRDKEGQELGVKRQEEDSRALAERRGWNVTKVYADNDVSASSGRIRPGWQQLLTDIESGEVQAVAAYSSSRLYRKLRDLLPFLELAKAKKLKVATVGSGDVDVSTADGRMMAHILASIDQGEAERVGERQQRKQRELKANGLWTGGRIPFGYRPVDGKLVVHSPEAELIRKAAAAVLNGTSLHSIARDWNAQGVTTTGGKQWRVGHVRMVLQRANPGVLTDTDSRKLRKLFADPKRTTSPRGGKYFLTGLLTCGRCGGSMVGRPQDGVRRYICLDTGSVHLTISAWPLELHVARQGSLMIPGNLTAIQDPQEPLVAEQEQIKSQLRDLGRKFADGDPFAEGQADRLRERLVEIEAQLGAPPEIQLDAETAGRMLEIIFREFSEDALQRSLAEPEARALIESLVDHVTVAPGSAAVEDRASIIWRPGVKKR